MGILLTFDRDLLEFLGKEGRCKMNEKEKFLFEMMFSGAYKAAVGRNPQGKKDINYQTNVKNICRKLIETYKSGTVTPKEHILNIAKIQDCGLNPGASQKVLNVLLKLYWCMGQIEMPSHCPVDRLVINNCKIKDKNKQLVKWTQMKTIEEYENIINQIANQKKPKHIAEWELEFWNSTRV